jgi:hypothetical protein
MANVQQEEPLTFDRWFGWVEWICNHLDEPENQLYPPEPAVLELWRTAKNDMRWFFGELLPKAMTNALEAERIEALRYREGDEWKECED